MHDTQGRKPDHERLFGICSGQAGYFTSAQARDSGYSSALLSHHAKGGRFTRVGAGLYRVRAYPSSSREDVVAAWLAAGADAVVSHESALDLLGLSDVVPAVVHLTVPRSKRYRRTSPGVTLHTTTRLADVDDVVVRDGIRVSAPARAIVEAAVAGVAPEQVVAAAIQAIARGMTTASQLRTKARARGGRVERLVSQAIEDARAV